MSEGETKTEEAIDAEETVETVVPEVVTSISKLGIKNPTNPSAEDIKVLRLRLADR